ncbi:hypothetical protein HMPREF1564_3837 [Providencia alcalifaciens R90-1475]|nr:hypothetical protein HMPREF1564_3837 [Providencia alcalifaciens R90-1475]
MDSGIINQPKQLPVIQLMTTQAPGIPPAAVNSKYSAHGFNAEL